MRYTGGYLTWDIDLIANANVNVTIPKRCIDVINLIQAIPYSIDPFLFNVCETLFRKNIAVQWSDPVMLPLPPHVDEGMWKEMSTEERKQHKRERMQTYDENNRRAVTRSLFANVLRTMKPLIGRKIWFPHFFDWRGRIYPKGSTALLPHGADYVKAYLIRGEGEQLTDEGRFWLEVGVATEYGHDKLSFNERAKWTRDNIDALKDIVAEPIETLDIWGGTDHPLTFLGLAKEYVEACADRAYKVRRGVSLDGTCNGFQHMAALVRDLPTGRVVNLCPGPRQDIYQMVADAMPPATRAQVKRAVMTTPYGVTSFGIVQQLKADRVLDPDVDEFAFGKKLSATINTVVSTSRLQEWLKSVADAHSDAGIDEIRWTSPSGWVNVQKKMKQKFVKVSLFTARGARIVVGHNEETETINKLKQRNSLSPNFVHSFDAAHMVALYQTSLIDEENPLTWPTPIHDSFNVHPNYTGELHTKLKETFHDQYEEDHLYRVYNEWRQIVEIPEPPELGELNIADVLKSEFIFS